MTPDWRRLFPDEDFRFRMGVRPGDARQFFAPPANSAELLAQRARSLDERPDEYAASLPDALPLVREAVARMAAWRGAGEIDTRGSAMALCLRAARAIEADWVILSPDADQHHPVAAGAVCFPSSWSLPEKLSLPMHGVHRPVPALNDALGRSIDAFLSRLSAGIAWERDNWGLGADAELDHHPSLPRRHLDDRAELNTTWLRWEQQLLARLPDTGAILFGIKISCHRLDRIAAVPDAARRLARALQTMPDEVAAYKGLAQCRQILSGRLRNATV